MFGKILNIVKKIADVVIMVLPYIGAWRGAKKAQKVTEAVMLGVQAFSKTQSGEETWSVLKEQLTDVAKQMGVDKKVQKLKERLEKKKDELEAKLAKKLFG